MSMTVVMIFVVLILGSVDAWAKLHTAKRHPQVNPNAVTMGHHYQRDTMFHDIMGL